MSYFLLYGIRFDRLNFPRKDGNKSAKLNLLEDFSKQVETFRARIAGSDPRHCINGHDFVGLLAKYISKATRSKNLADPDVVERQLTADLDYKRLAEEPMFKELLARVRQ